MQKVLIVDDHANIRVALEGILTQRGYQVTTAAGYNEALPVIEGDDLGVVITDLKMPGKSGMDLLEASRRLRPEIPVIMVTGHGNIADAVAAMKTGAFDFITKPVDENELLTTLQKALAVSDRNIQIPSDYFEPADNFDPGFIGDSLQIREAFKVVGKIGPTDSTVLVTGETGVGKELVARAIHMSSPRKNGPFVKVHCAAIPENLVESELFGHEKGAFTGAVSDKPGRIELAEGGTLFLDEVGEIPLMTQVKLLTVLQDRTFERVGGVKTINADMRFVAATNRDLEAAVKEDLFRADLYYRLAVVPVHIPPLRERREDIGLQVDHFMSRFKEKYDKQTLEMGHEILTALYNYDWPGNTRELENTVERLVLLAEGNTISADDLPPQLSKCSSSGASDGLKERAGDVSRAAEKNMIMEALEHTSGNRTKTAQILGISRRTLYKKMKEYGL